jgi:hypothetical protein
MNWTMQTLDRALCGLHGHEAVLHFERHRLSLRCLNCGHETTGWILRSETRRAEPLVDDFSHRHTNRLGRWQRMFEAIIGVSLARRLGRLVHATT